MAAATEGGEERLGVHHGIVEAKAGRHGFAREKAPGVLVGLGHHYRLPIATAVDQEQSEKGVRSSSILLARAEDELGEEFLPGVAAINQRTVAPFELGRHFGFPELAQGVSHVALRGDGIREADEAVGVLR